MNHVNAVASRVYLGEVAMGVSKNNDERHAVRFMSPREARVLAKQLTDAANEAEKLQEARRDSQR